MSSPSNDRPISGTANIMLQVGAAATILLFYFFVLCSVTLLLALLGVEIIILLAAARFGGATLFAPVINRHGGLLMIFFRSLWLGKSVEYRIPLQQQDAPDLFSLLGTICARAKVQPPRKVYLQMGVSAYVQLKGLRRGASNTHLGMGYDLLAGLSQREIEGVLAHEMMHAKLVQRGFRQLLNKGVFRAGRLSNGLIAQVAADRRNKKSVIFISNFMHLADTLTRLAARQVSACSRQDEFAADLGAAEICGAGAIRSALLKLDDLERVASRLPLRDRIAQLESGESFEQWLVRELAVANAAGPVEAKAEVFNTYSTHPSLHDRLAALATYPDQSLEDSPPAIRLLANPDQVAEDLVRTIQKQLIAQEQADSKKLGRWSRKTRTTRQVGFTRFMGFVLLLGGLIGALYWGCSGMDPVVGILSFLTFALGIALFVLGGYKEKTAFPVPDYTLIKTTDQKKLKIEQAEVDALEKELHLLAEEGSSRRKRTALYLQHSIAALGECNYVRAHVAARLFLKRDKKSIPGHLALAIAAGGIRQTQQAVQAIRFVQQRTGMKGDSTAWAAGWALALIGDWVYAEIFLAQARQKKPAEPTVHALLSIAQLKRGKLFSAIGSARKAHTLQPDNLGYTKLLVDLLLQGGFLREAHEHLQHLANEAVADPELAFCMVMLTLSQRNFPIAEEWMAIVAQNSAGPEKFVTLAVHCENARHDEKAFEYFQHALTHGHYPEALFGLGRLEAHRQNKDQARTHLIAALDLHRPAGENSTGAVDLVVPIIHKLRSLQEPVLNCRGWIASITGQPASPALNNTSFVVFGLNEGEAKQFVRDFLEALQPGHPLPSMRWKPAPREQQPDGPACPGVQYVL